MAGNGSSFGPDPGVISACIWVLCISAPLGVWKAAGGAGHLDLPPRLGALMDKTYPDMQVKPVRGGKVGLIISGTEYVMPIAELARLHGMIGVALWPPPASMATSKESTPR